MCLTTLCDVNKFVGDLRQVGGFLQVLWFPPAIKLTVTIQQKMPERDDFVALEQIKKIIKL
jgi:hypothetical protein